MLFNIEEYKQFSDELKTLLELTYREAVGSAYVFAMQGADGIADILEMLACKEEEDIDKTTMLVIDKFLVPYYHASLEKEKRLMPAEIMNDFVLFVRDIFKLVFYNPYEFIKKYGACLDCVQNDTCEYCPSFILYNVKDGR